MRYCFKMRDYMKKAAHTIAVVPNSQRLYQKQPDDSTFAIKVCEVMRRFNITSGHVKLAFLYKLLNFREQSWSIALMWSSLCTR